MKPITNRPIPSFSERDKSRFWAKVDIRGPNECWTWKAGTVGNGYGQFHICPSKNTNQMFLAHRASYYLTTGYDPKNLDVLHRCDNPACVNPDHLVVGTHSDNVADMMTKGRDRKVFGSRHHKAKITEEDVLKIRSMEGAMTQSEIAKTFGITQSVVSSILLRRIWRHV